MDIIFILIAFIIAAIRSNTTIGSSDYFKGADIDTALKDDAQNQNNFVFFILMLPLIIVLIAFIVILSFTFESVLGLILIPILISILIIGYYLKNSGKDRDAKRRRENALKKAGACLSPYKDIWRNLTLSNKYCSLKLRFDGTTIVGKEKKTDPYLPYRTFKVTKSNVYNSVELWNLFCVNFSYNISYEGLLEACNRFRVSIYEDIVTPPQPSKKHPEFIKQIDINNCSEAELTALPGISIVISKKIIKKREEIGGFKSVGDVLAFINLKPNVTEQLKPQICVKKMVGSLNLKRNRERTIDL